MNNKESSLNLTISTIWLKVIYFNKCMRCHLYTIIIIICGSNYRHHMKIHMKNDPDMSYISIHNRKMQILFTHAYLFAIICSSSPIISNHLAKLIGSRRNTKKHTHLRYYCLISECNLLFSAVQFELVCFLEKKSGHG